MRPSLFRQVQLVRSYSGYPAGAKGTPMRIRGRGKTPMSLTFIGHDTPVDLTQEKVPVMFCGHIIYTPASELVVLR